MGVILSNALSLPQLIHSIMLGTEGQIWANLSWLDNSVEIVYDNLRLSERVNNSVKHIWCCFPRICANVSKLGLCAETSKI